MLMVAEMTGSLSILAPAMIAVGLAWFIVRRGDDTIYRSQLKSRADAPAQRLLVGMPLLANVPVLQAMAPPRLVLEGRHLSSGARRQIEEVGVPGAPVVDDDGRFEGAVSLDDLNRLGDEADARTIDAAVDASTPTVIGSAHLDVALDALTTASQHWVPVLDNDRAVIGTIAISDVVRGYRLGLLASLRQLDGTDRGAGTHDVEITARSSLVNVALRRAGLPGGVIVTSIQTRTRPRCATGRHCAPGWRSPHRHRGTRGYRGGQGESLRCLTTSADTKRTLTPSLTSRRVKDQSRVTYPGRAPGADRGHRHRSSGDGVVPERFEELGDGSDADVRRPPLRSVSSGYRSFDPSRCSVRSHGESEVAGELAGEFFVASKLDVAVRQVRFGVDPSAGQQHEGERVGPDNGVRMVEVVHEAGSSIDDSSEPSLDRSVQFDEHAGSVRYGGAFADDVPEAAPHLVEGQFERPVRWCGRDVRAGPGCLARGPRSRSCGWP